MPNSWNVSDRVLGGMAAWRQLAPQPFAPQPFAPAPAPFQPDRWTPQPQPQPYAPQPAPQPYSPPAPPQNYPPMPQPYAPPPYAPPPAPQPYAPQPYAPAPQPYAPAPQPYAPAPQPYAPAPQPQPRFTPGGQVLTLNPGNFAQEVLQAPGVTIVDFYATYCGPCKDLAPVLDQMAATQANSLRIGKVTCDVDGKAIQEQFGVRAFPTMVVFKDGKEIGRVEGGLNAAEMAEWQRRGFPKLG